MEKGTLSYEYNLFEIQRTRIDTNGPLPTGKVKIEIESRLTEQKHAAPMDVVIRVNGKEVAKGRVPVTASLTFTANDAFDVGMDSYSPVSLAYFDRAPFKFNGKIDRCTFAISSVLLTRGDPLASRRPATRAGWPPHGQQQCDERVLRDGRPQQEPGVQLRSAEVSEVGRRQQVVEEQRVHDWTRNHARARPARDHQCKQANPKQASVHGACSCNVGAEDQLRDEVGRKHRGQTRGSLRKE